MSAPRAVLAAVIAFSLIGLFTTSSLAAAKKYQVTGTVLSVNDQMIVVQKANDEKWEIDRTADTKVEGELKVGAKVTVYYHMTADRVESKGESKEK